MEFKQAVQILDSIAAQVNMSRQDHIRALEAVQVVRGEHERLSAMAMARQGMEKAKDAQPMHRDSK